MLQALVQESHLDLKSMGTPRFDWGIYSFCDSEDSHALFDCNVLRAQMQSLAKRGIIWIEREIMQKGDCMAASSCPPITQLGTNFNAISVGLKKDWDKYLLKCLGLLASAHSFSVVIEEIVETLANPGSLDSGKGQVPPAIGGFAPLVVTLPMVTRPASPLVQEGATIAPTIRGFNPLILPKPALGISGVSGSKALEAILPSPMVINPKMFSIEPNLQTYEGVIIRMPKPFPYKDSHRVP